MKNLYIFTVKFPYTKTTECFLEDEIKYLANRFDKITIIPLQKETSSPKELLVKCHVIPPVLGGHFHFLINGLFNICTIGILLRDFFKKHVYFDRIKLLSWVKCYFIANNLLNSSKLKEIRKAIKQDDVCYFYWGKWSNLLSLFWKGECKMVSRFHGEFDLWEEVYKGYVPLRRKVVESLDAAVFISSKGEAYFKSKYPQCKTFYFPLGTNDLKTTPYFASEEIRVLSCSNVIPLKRIPLIFDALLAINDRKIKWIHIGDGSDMDYLKKTIKTKEHKNLTIVLMGAMEHKDVMSFYEKECFDVFVNLSKIEGVPVSIMEAISCDIPVVATDVGGTSEVVAKETGVLVSANPSPNEVAAAIRTVIKLELHPRVFWNNHYNAQINYKRFTDFLYTI